MGRLLIGKVGFDGHDRGVKVVARALRDAGHEIIYTGLHQTPDQVVTTAVQEDVDLLGISILSGAHMTLIPDILEGLEEHGRSEIPVVLGGVIPKDDEQELIEQGVEGVFRPGTALPDIVDFVENQLDEPD